MAESVYKIMELVGTSTESWEAAARSAVERASSTLRDLRIAEVEKFDMTVDKSRILYRARVRLSFKYEEG
jgi:flavin-binding protein dodecin